MGCEFRQGDQPHEQVRVQAGRQHRSRSSAGTPTHLQSSPPMEPAMIRNTTPLPASRVATILATDTALSGGKRRSNQLYV